MVKVGREGEQQAYEKKSRSQEKKNEKCGTSSSCPLACFLSFHRTWSLSWNTSQNQKTLASLVLLYNLLFVDPRCKTFISMESFLTLDGDSTQTELAGLPTDIETCEKACLRAPNSRYCVAANRRYDGLCVTSGYRVSKERGSHHYRRICRSGKMLSKYKYFERKSVSVDGLDDIRERVYISIFSVLKSRVIVLSKNV